MQKVLYYTLAFPFIIVCSVAEFIVWGKYDSDKRQEAQQRRSYPVANRLGQEIESARQIRDLDYKSRRKIEELEEALRKERKSKKR
ncbi:MAG: hypothetical protein H8D34_04020 [Chloroflexi bacterium]|nr:hypothetical protein [Chloroflexota bacterium]